MENGSFAQVRKDGVSIVSLQRLNLVFPEAPGGAKVEVTRVFITQSAVFNFCALSPVVRLISIFFTKVNFCNSAKARFQGGEVTNFFQPVQEGDNRATINQVDGGEAPILGPSPSSRPNPFKLKAQTPNGREVQVRGAHTVPVCGNNVGEI
jgi:hypothetical protein